MVKRVRLRYRSEEQFIGDYPRLLEGSFFLPSSDPLPAGIEVVVEMYVPGLSGMFPFEATVAGETGAGQNPGNQITIGPGAAPTLEKLARHAARIPRLREALDLPEPTDVTAPRVAISPTDPTPPPRPASPTPPPRPASPTPPPRPASPTPPPRPAAPKPQKTKLDWLREVVGKEDLVIAPDTEPEAPPPAPPERKELTVTERERVKPVGEFIMDLAKAMLRSGYYSPDHPGAQQAKTGLYESLLRAVGDKNELMLINQETREKTDVLISGILDEPVSVRMVVGQGMAELFVPRLHDFFDRKALVSFALKRRITPQHFETFVDIMSDPKVERAGKEGCERLTRSLADAGITEVSTVFMDDLILFQEKLPWRVEMTIHRLAKDLKVLPMFKGIGPDEMKSLKFKIIEDIVRPLGHPDLLRDIVVNCHIIARAVPGVDHVELEKTIITAFPQRMVLPTSRFILEQLARIQEALRKAPEDPVLVRRQLEVKRILKHIAGRMVDENIAGAEKFLEQLFYNKILLFAELPPEVQYRVNTVRLTRDVKEHLPDYEQALRQARDADEGLVVLRSFRRVLPGLFADGSWDTVNELIAGIDRAAPLSPALRTGELPANPLVFIFHEHLDALSAALDRTKKEDQGRAAEAVARLGPTGVELLLKVMIESKDRGVRKMAVDGLVKAAELSRPRVLQILLEGARPWFVHRNALLVLSYIGEGPGDRERVRSYLTHREPRLREEALHAVVRLEGAAAEPLVLAALNDPNVKVRRRAVASLGMIQPPSANTVKKLLEMLAAPPPKGKEEAKAYEQKTAMVARALGALAGLKDYEPIEQALIAAARERLAKKAGLLRRIRSKMEDEDEPWVAIAAAESLGRIGGHSSLMFLATIGDDQDELSKKAREAEEKLRTRQVK